jgi:hypothetical protein
MNSLNKTIYDQFIDYLTRRNKFIKYGLRKHSIVPLHAEDHVPSFVHR